MLPASLKLVDLGHCHVQLPQVLVTKLNVKPGAVISMKSVQKDTEIYAIWNGNFTSADYAELDAQFARANGFQEELIVLSALSDQNVVLCSRCRVELIDSSEISILSQHLDINLLDTCKLVATGLIIPIKVQQHVQVFVKISHIEPSGRDVAMLTRETEMQFIHYPTKERSECQQEPDETSSSEIELDPVGLSSLSIGPKAKLPISTVLICGEKGSGKTHYLQEVLRSYNTCKGELVDCKKLFGRKPESIKKTLFELIERATSQQPFIIALDNIDAIAYKSDNDQVTSPDTVYHVRCVDILCRFFKITSDYLTKRDILVVCTCLFTDNLDDRISKPKGFRVFDRVISIIHASPYEGSRLVESVLKQYDSIGTILNATELEYIANKCASFIPADIKQIVERGFIRACAKSLHQFDSNPIKVQLNDLMEALDGYKPVSLRSVNFQKKTPLTFDNIGGMSDVKQALSRTILNQIKYQTIFAKSSIGPQNSILLYGPPGCGKTLIAEALMNDQNLRSICIRGPELLSKYIGGSEAAIRELFKKAHLLKPCIIFFDEFESLVSKRGSDSTGVTDRVVNQFLTLMDGKEKLSRGIFILAASSRPNMIDPAILRPGRMDQHIYCDLPGKEDRLDILDKLSKKLDFEEDRFKVFKFWADKTEHFTGADLQFFLQTAQMKSLHEKINLVTKEDLKLVVKGCHLSEAYESLRIDVEARKLDVQNNYPKSMFKMNGPIAARATLA